MIMVKVAISFHLSIQFLQHGLLSWKLYSSSISLLVYEMSSYLMVSFALVLNTTNPTLIERSSALLTSSHQLSLPFTSEWSDPSIKLHWTSSISIHLLLVLQQKKISLSMEPLLPSLYPTMTRLDCFSKEEKSSKRPI